MANQTIVVVVGLGAAFLFALAAFQQRLATQQVIGSNVSSLRRATRVWTFFGLLVRNQTWLAGVAANVGAFALQAAALSMASVAAVQPLIATELVFVLVLVSVQLRRWPTMHELAAATAVCGGLILLLTTESWFIMVGAPHRGRILIAAGCLVIVVAVVVVATANRVVPLRMSSMLLGAAAGLCQAMSAVALKMVTDSLSGSDTSTVFTDWPLYLLVPCVLAGVALGQLAFATGALPPAVAAMSVTNPVTGLVLGLSAFDVPVPSDLNTLVATGFAMSLISVGVIRLAPTGQRAGADGSLTR